MFFFFFMGASCALLSFFISINIDFVRFPMPKTSKEVYDKVAAKVVTCAPIALTACITKSLVRASFSHQQRKHRLFRPWTPPPSRCLLSRLSLNNMMPVLIYVLWCSLQNFITVDIFLNYVGNRA